MLTLGPIGLGDMRTQTIDWLDYLDTAHLERWRIFKLNSLVRKEIEKVRHEARRPAPLLIEAIMLSMSVIAKRWPYVVWKAGGKPPQLGFYPDRKLLARSIMQERVIAWSESVWESGIFNPASFAGTLTKHFIVYDTYLEWYKLCNINRKELWIIHQRWTYAGAVGEYEQKKRSKRERQAIAQEKWQQLRAYANQTD